MNECLSWQRESAMTFPLTTRLKPIPCRRSPWGFRSIRYRSGADLTQRSMTRSSAHSQVTSTRVCRFLPLHAEPQEKEPSAAPLSASYQLNIVPPKYTVDRPAPREYFSKSHAIFPRHIKQASHLHSCLTHRLNMSHIFGCCMIQPWLTLSPIFTLTAIVARCIAGFAESAQAIDAW